MISTSAEYKAQIKMFGRNPLKSKATITFSDGTLLNIDDSRIRMGGMMFDDKTSSSGTLEVGCAAIQELELWLDNGDDYFSDYDFSGAIIVPQVGLELQNGTTEWITRGKFVVYDPISKGSVITVVALDNMEKFDRDYTTNLTFPATLFQVLQDVCTTCGVSLASNTLSFPNSTYVVTQKPSTENTNCREIVAYCAQLAASYAKINNLGELYFSWYKTDLLVEETNLDGGDFSGASNSTVTGTSISFDSPTNSSLVSVLQSGHTAQKVTVQGKNLLDVKPGTVAANGVTCTVESDGTITLNGTATAYIYFTITTKLSVGVKGNSTPVISMTSGLKYTMSKSVISGTYTGQLFHEGRDTAGTSWPANFIFYQANDNTRTMTAGTAWSAGWSTSLNIGLIDIQISTGSTYNNYKYRLQFEQSASATAWTPFVPNSPSPDYPSPITGVTKTTVNGVDYTLPQTLYSLPNGTADDNEVVGGQGLQKVGKAIFNGSETWSKSALIADLTLTTAFRIIDSNVSNQSESSVSVQSDSFLSVKRAGATPNILNSDIECAAGGNGYLIIRIFKSRLTGWQDAWTDAQKVAAFKSWLSANTVTVLYQLATPTAITGTPKAIPTSLHNTITNDGGGQISAIYPNPYPTGDTADGGDFLNYRNKPDYDGGLFATPTGYAPTLDNITNVTISTDDVHVTGVQIIPKDDSKPAYFKGANGYVISIENNPLAQDNIDQLVANMAVRLVDFVFRPMSVDSMRDDPSIEAGDVAYVVDSKGNKHKTIISSLNFKINSKENFKADAESEKERQSTRYSVASKAVLSAKEQTQRQITTYDLAVQQLASTLAMSMGTFQTVDKQENGSEIVYLHDQPTLEGSKKIWKRTADAIAVSNDGGTTWRGMDASGNIVAAVLTVIGINADWIKTGRITSATNPNMYIDLSSGILYLAGASGKGLKIDASGNVTFDGNVSANGITTGKIRSSNSKVYFDLDNAVISASTLVSTTNTNNSLRIGHVLSSAPANTGFGMILNDENGNKIYSAFNVYNEYTAINATTNELDISCGVEGSIDSAQLTLGRGYFSLYSATSTDDNGAIECYNGNVSINGNSIQANGNFSVINGSKNAVVTTKDYGDRAISAYETAEYYFGDIGYGQIESGECRIDIDPVFAQCVNTEIDYHVFLTPIGDFASIYVAEMNKDYFVVKSDKDIKFSWELKAKRLGYEDVRLKEFKIIRNQ